MLVLFFVTATATADLDVVLYGATGCVGHLAAHYLANTTVAIGARPLNWAIADFNETRLNLLAEELKSAGGPSSQPIVVVADTMGPNTSALLDLVRRAAVVATAAGPFSIHGGETLVHACATAGVSYVDISDEFYWQREMLDRYHTEAESSGASMVIASGFCVLAGEIGAQTALSHLNTSGGVNVDAFLEVYNGEKYSHFLHQRRLLNHKCFTILLGGLSKGVLDTPKNATYPKSWNTDPVSDPAIKFWFYTNS